MSNIKEYKNGNHESQASAPTAALTIAITSGKGGVGKTNVTTNLGIALAKAGKKVCIFDADTSLANINILLNLTPEYTLEHFLRDNLAIDDILLTGPEGMQIVPAATGIADFTLLNSDQQSKLLSALEQLEQRFDYILIDTAAGISDSVIRFIQSAQYAVTVISPEPTSLTDAFSLVKVLQRRDYEQPIYVLVNMANNYAHSMEVFKRFAHAVNKYIQTKVRYLGYIPTDKAVRHAIASQTPVTISEPNSPAGRCITLLANILLKHFTSDSAPIRKISQFWRSQSQDLPEQALESFSASSIEQAHQDTIAPAENAQQKSQQTATMGVEELPPTQLIESVLATGGLSQPQADSVLADLIQYYLGEFGTLPSQAIDLVLQAHAQGELSDKTLEKLQQQIPPLASEDETGPESESPRTEQPTEQQSHKQQPHKQPPMVEQIQSQIDNLVEDAERTKKELTELADHLKLKYRELYNMDLSRPQSAVRSLQSAKNPSAKQKPNDDTASLLQSIQYAAAVDRKPE